MNSLYPVFFIPSSTASTTTSGSTSLHHTLIRSRIVQNSYSGNTNHIKKAVPCWACQHSRLAKPATSCATSANLYHHPVMYCPDQGNKTNLLVGVWMCNSSLNSIRNILMSWINCTTKPDDRKLLWYRVICMDLFWYSSCT